MEFSVVGLFERETPGPGMTPLSNCFFALEPEPILRARGTDVGAFSPVREAKQADEGIRAPAPARYGFAN